MGFRFKQFTIEDDACAMKVGTDSIMLGSWLQANHTQRILDIGTGCGLLSIMLAQKTNNDCLIDGIDIDSRAVEQAKDNALNCPWSERLHFYSTSLQQFSECAEYDLIVTNPPYFPINSSANKAQKSNDRVTARQTIELDHPTLLQHVAKHLSTSGQFYCVLPASVARLFISQAESIGLFCCQELQVQPKPQADVSRFLLRFSRTKQRKDSKAINIYDHSGGYSSEYIALCKDYYFNF